MGVTFQPPDPKIEEGAQRLPSHAHMAQAHAGMGQDWFAASLADSGDHLGRMRERGPFRGQVWP
jgi:hypothetical protein